VSVAWRKRVAFVAVTWAVLFAITAAAQTDPEPFLLASLIVGACAVIWLAVDLSDLAERAQWSTYALSGGRRRGADARVGVLQRALVDVATRDDRERLHSVLVGLIDDRLAAHHGIDRAAEPARAEEILGDELSRFIAAPPKPVYFGNPVYLSRILTDIEHL